MPQRVAISRIIVGVNEEQKVIEPGTTFSTEEYNMSEEDVKRYDETGVTREPQAQPKASDQTGPRDRSEMTPMEESEQGLVTEGRSPVDREQNVARSEAAAPRSVPQNERRETAQAQTDRNRTARRDHDL